MNKLKNPVLSQEQAERLYRCVVCEKQISQFYGRWGSGGSCSRKCELIQEEKPKDLGEPK